MKNKKIIPAIIAKSQKEFEEKINKVKDFVDIIQLDFMDGKFVPNSSINFDFKIPSSDCVFEAHLMIQDPLKWVEKYYKKVDTILIHFESCKNPKKVIDIVKKKGKRIGFVLNPETPIDSIQNFLDDINQVLIMTVNPGFYGSPFLPEMIDKIKKLRKKCPNLDIEVDGGITDKTIGLVNEAGANLFVSGSYIVKSDNIKKAIDNLDTIIGE
ncbi:MAG: ribulose-phosphate 3-epimerase [Candidatus Thermoplasmatota archaeon]|nr:ribulose-phosphate 3-epimerase [Candidatus Thermoplasmatota archaeon]